MKQGDHLQTLIRGLIDKNSKAFKKSLNQNEIRGPPINLNRGFD
jgi:hypothetical protein